MARHMGFPDPSSDRRPRPGDDFEWRTSSAGGMLVCRALEPYAMHLFTTREWRLGTTTADERDTGWRDVATAMGVDPAQLIRAHQVHGTGVVVRRSGDAAAGASLPDADILVSDDTSVALA